MAKAKAKRKPAAKAKKKLSVVPKGQSTPTAYIGVKNASAVIKFYAKAFGAKELFRLTEPSGKVSHAEIAIGEATMMIADEYPDFGCASPQTIGGSPVQFHLYVKNADAAVKKAVKAGAKITRPVMNQFYGDRTGSVADPFGYRWMISHRVEQVSPKEMQRRWRELLKGGE